MADSRDRSQGCGSRYTHPMGEELFADHEGEEGSERKLSGEEIRWMDQMDQIDQILFVLSKESA